MCSWKKNANKFLLATLLACFTQTLRWLDRGKTHEEDPSLFYFLLFSVTLLQSGCSHFSHETGSCQWKWGHSVCRLANLASSFMSYKIMKFVVFGVVKDILDMIWLLNLFLVVGFSMTKLKLKFLHSHEIIKSDDDICLHRQSSPNILTLWQLGESTSIYLSFNNKPFPLGLLRVT